MNVYFTTGDSGNAYLSTLENMSFGNNIANAVTNRISALKFSNW